MEPVNLADVISNATAAGILAAVLYFSFRLLDRIIDIIISHSQRLDELLAEAIRALQEKES
jgi:hypothetical protein